MTTAIGDAQGVRRHRATLPVAVIALLLGATSCSTSSSALDPTAGSSGPATVTYEVDGERTATVTYEVDGERTATVTYFDAAGQYVSGDAVLPWRAELAFADIAEAVSISIVANQPTAEPNGSLSCTITVNSEEVANVEDVPAGNSDDRRVKCAHDRGETTS